MEKFNLPHNGLTCRSLVSRIRHVKKVIDEQKQGQADTCLMHLNIQLEVNNYAIRISSTIGVESIYRSTVNALTMKAESGLNTWISAFLHLSICYPR